MSADLDEGEKSIRQEEKNQKNTTVWLFLETPEIRMKDSGN
jgi:hypothetical protein